MNNERELEFDEVMYLKEKRRASRERDRQVQERTKNKSGKMRQRNVKNISYDPYYDEDYEDYEGL